MFAICVNREVLILVSARHDLIHIGQRSDTISSYTRVRRRVVLIVYFVFAYIFGTRVCTIIIFKRHHSQWQLWSLSPPLEKRTEIGTDRSVRAIDILDNVRQQPRDAATDKTRV